MKNKKKKILITGGSGFIGRNLINYFLENHKDMKIYTTYNNKKIKFRNTNSYKVDLTKKSQLNKLPSDYDLVIHLAGIREAFLNKRKGMKQFFSNINMLFNMLNHARKINCKKFIFFSSVYIYSGSNKKLFKEHDKSIPLEILGKSKYLCELLLKNFSIQNNFNSISLRLFTTYGHNSNKKQFITSTINKFRSNRKKIFFKNANIKRDFIYIEDVNEVVSKIVDKIYTSKINYNIYNLASGKSYKIKQVINIISNILRLRKEVIFNENIIEKERNTDHNGDISKLRKFIKWKPKFTLESGIKKII